MSTVYADMKLTFILMTAVMAAQDPFARVEQETAKVAPADLSRKK